MTSRYSLDEI